MEKVIDFAQKRQEKECESFVYEPLYREINFVCQESKKRTSLTFTVEEMMILLSAYLNYIECTLDKWRHLTEQEKDDIWEDTKNDLNEITYLCFRLVKKMMVARVPSEPIEVLWGYRRIYLSMIALESTDSVSLEPYETYESFEEIQKIELHLYKRFREVNKKRLQRINPRIYRLSYETEHLSEPIQRERTRIEILRKQNEQKYQQELVQKVVLTEEIKKLTENHSRNLYIFTKEYDRLIENCEMAGLHIS